ncbi:MAG: hypothetical protein A2X49_14220 [Lentisphaerae bacterium GWF2_52_8]|nr:MAG: hypothetical protein A2X49_14220 [Lentisphaerae bacterium GWF2_52_8]
MSFKVQKLEEAREEELCSLLKTSATSLFYLSPRYNAFLEKYLGAECHRWACLSKDGEALLAVFTLILKRAPLGLVANSLPFYGSNGGFAFLEPTQPAQKAAMMSAIRDAVFAFLEGLGCAAFTIVTSPFDEMAKWHQSNWQHDFTDIRIGQITFLPEGVSRETPKALIDIFEEPRPRNIRKALKDGVSCRISSSEEDFEFLARLHRENISSIGGISKDAPFFKMVRSFFNDGEYELRIAEIKGERVAALLLFPFNKTVEYFTPAVREDARNSQPLCLLIYEAMLDFAAKGFLHWNWGGTWLTQDGVYKFKRKWGARDMKYHYYTKLWDKSLLSSTREELLKHFKNFYIMPFSAIEEKPLRKESAAI